MVLKPKRLSELTAEERRRLMQRATLDIEAVRREVEEIIRDVRSRGDEAILSWYEKFYGKPILKRGELRVQEEEFKEVSEKEKAKEKKIGGENNDINVKINTNIHFLFSLLRFFIEIVN